MRHFFAPLLFLMALHAPALAADPDRTIRLFKETPGSAEFFDKSFGFAVFPNIGKAGVVVGGAFGKGIVYKEGVSIGRSEMSQITIGLQLGAQAYSQIIFFKDQRALDEFIGSKFEFGADASAVALTLGASASAGSTGASASQGVEKNKSKVTGRWFRGMAVFTVAKGGLMYQATIGGQTFKFSPN